MNNIFATLTIDSFSNYEDLLADGDTRDNYEESIRDEAALSFVDIEEFIYDEDQDLVLVRIAAPNRERVIEWMVATSPELSGDEAAALLDEALAA